jgi:uncharacterized protein (DUF302 family)
MMNDSLHSGPDISTKMSPRSVSETVTRLTELLTKNGLTLFAVIDQAEAARKSGLSLRPTILVVFGDPAAGTPVMEAEPLSALDLPLKVLVWQDGELTKVSYLSPGALADRYRLNDGLAEKLAGIDRLTDVLISQDQGSAST